jgi:diguanylate cyclase (GGDEF)-like protein
VNDTYGHAIGDAILRGVGGLLSRWVRKCDFVARIGGEEFVVIAPTTPREGAFILAERLRAGLDSSPLVASTQSGMHARIRVTASVGMACLDPRVPGSSTTSASLVEAADAALYRAKNGGRNRVECV